MRSITVSAVSLAALAPLLLVLLSACGPDDDDRQPFNQPLCPHCQPMQQPSHFVTVRTHMHNAIPDGGQ